MTRVNSKWLGRVINTLWLLLATLVLIGAISIVSIRQFLLPNLDAFKLNIQGEASRIVGKPVTLDSVSGQWSTRGPTFLLTGISVTDPETLHQIKLNSAELSFDVWRSLWNGQIITDNIYFQGLNLSVYEGAGFNFEVQGFNQQNNEQVSLNIDPILDLFYSQAQVSIANSTIQVERYNGHQYDVVIPSITIKNDSDWHSIQGNASVAEQDSFKISALFDGDPRLSQSQGELYVEGQNVALKSLPFYAIDEAIQVKGKLNLSMWLDWKQGGFSGGQLKHQIDDYAWRYDQLKSKDVHSISGDWLLSHQNHHWSMSSHNFSLTPEEAPLANRPSKQALDTAVVMSPHLTMKGADSSLQMHIDIPEIEIATTLSVMQLPLLLTTGYNYDQQEMAAGNIKDVELDFSLGEQSQLLSAQANIEGLDVHSEQYGSHVKGLSASVSMDNNQAWMQLKTRDGFMQWSQGFSHGMHIESLTGDIHLFWLDNSVYSQFEKIGLKTQSVDLSIDGEVTQFHDEPIQIAARVDGREVNVTEIKTWLPLKQMGIDAEDFLQSAFKQGQVSQLWFNWFSEWNQFDSSAFNNLLGKAKLSNLVVKFDPDWPEAGLKKGDISLVGDNIYVSSQSAWMADFTDIPTQSSVKTLFGDQPVVAVNANTQRTYSESRSWLQQTPLKSITEPVTEFVEMEDIPLPAQFTIEIPLNDVDQFTFDLALELPKIDVVLGGDIATLTDLSGEFSIDQSSFKSKDLRAYVYSNNASKLSIDGDFLPSGDVEAQFSGQGSIEIADYLTLWLGNIPGVGPGQVDYELMGSFKAIEDKTSYDIRVKTPLRQIELDLPAPFHKKKGQPLLSEARIHGQQDFLQLDVNIGDALRSFHRFSLPGAKWQRGSLLINSDAQLDFDDERTLFTDIVVEEVDVQHWIDWLSKYNFNNSSSSSPLIALKGGVVIKQLRWQNVALGQVHASFQPNEEQVSIMLSGEHIEGLIKISKDQNQLINVTLERLQLPDFPESWFADSEMEFESELEAEVTAGSIKAEDLARPYHYPNLVFDCKSCQVKALDLGRVHFEAYRRTSSNHSAQTGLLPEQMLYRLSLKNDQQIDADVSGSWQFSPEKGHSFSAAGFLNTDSIDGLLSGLNIDAGIKESAANSTFSFLHHGSPFNFSLENVSGTTQANLTAGKLLQISDEKARIFSLLSIQNIFRRLVLDFSNLYEKGFFYDSIDIHLSIAKGVVYSDNVKVKGNAANVILDGRTDLANKQFYQHAVVHPQLSDSLPVLMGWAIEPTTGLVVMLLNELLSPAIEVVTAIEYNLTGTFKEPVVTKVSEKDEKIAVPEKIIKEERKKQQDLLLEQQKEKQKQQQDIPVEGKEKKPLS